MGFVAVGRVTSARALWTSFVVAFATLSYSLRFTEGKPPRNLLYKWSTLVGNLVQFAIIAAIVYGIAGLTSDRRETLALRRPSSWATAARIGAGVIAGMIVLSQVLGPSHAGAYIANAIGIAVVAPIVEELTFRGLGYSLFARYGRWTAIVATGVAFGLAHGLVQALPLLVAFGIGLAYLRSRVGSVFPGMIVHGLFNATALTVAVAGKPQVGILRACAAAWSALSPF